MVSHGGLPMPCLVGLSACTLCQPRVGGLCVRFWVPHRYGMVSHSGCLAVRRWVAPWFIIIELMIPVPYTLSASAVRCVRFFGVGGYGMVSLGGTLCVPVAVPMVA